MSRLRTWFAARYLSTWPRRCMLLLALLFMAAAVWAARPGCEDLLFSTFPPECRLHADGHLAASQTAVLLGSVAAFLLALLPPRRS